MDALQEARSFLEAYQYRINQDTYHGDLESRTRYENCAYQEGMLQAAIAQAEQLKRIADSLEYYVGKPEPVDPVLADYHKNSFPGESMLEYGKRMTTNGPLHTVSEPSSPLDNF